MTVAFGGPTFCANTGASLPQAWEFAWTGASAAVARLASPVAPLPVDTSAWPSAFDAAMRLRLHPSVRRLDTPTSFAWSGAGPLTALYRPDSQRLVELPRAVAAQLLSGVLVGRLLEEWTHLEPEVRDVPRRAVALARFGFVHGHGIETGPSPTGRSSCIQEAWTVRGRNRNDEDVLSSAVMGSLLKPGPAALQLWERCRDGVSLASVTPVGCLALDTMTAGGLTRWTEPSDVE